MSRQHEYLDFELAIGLPNRAEYPVDACCATLGELHETRIFSEGESTTQWRAFQAVLAEAAGFGGAAPPDPSAAKAFGQQLFETLFTGALRSFYDQSRHLAAREGKRLRLRLIVEPPELAALPWELLYDGRVGRGEFVGLANITIVRSLRLPGGLKPLEVPPPLRVLGMVVSPANLPPLDTAREQRLVEEALGELQAQGRVALTWMQGRTWQDLQQELRRGDYHVFHFVGHGGFDTVADEGYLALEDADGQEQRLGATQIARLLDGQDALRLVLLNACEGARASQHDVFSSTAATIVARGAPAVVAMQYPISNQAAAIFARGFYSALADRFPVDAAVSEAREALSIADGSSIAWVTPVLYLRSPDGRIFAPEVSSTCPACGLPTRAGARFCRNCGSPLSSGPDRPISPTPAPRQFGRPAPPSSSPPEGGEPLRAGTTLGPNRRFRVERLLGKGGFGEAYLARDTQLGRPCVIKRLVLSPGWDEATRGMVLANFQREARLLVSLNTPGHPHIPEIYEWLPESRCLVIKFIDGQNLAQLQAQQGSPLPISTALRYARDVCAALVYMHSRSPEPVLHRDVKPGNVLLDSEGRIWLIDFGLAKSLPQAALAADPNASSHAGTPGYTAPEQWRGAAQPQSDVYALAATLHTLLTDYQPGRSDAQALMQGRQSLPPLRALRPDAPPELERLLEQALAFEPAHRPNARDLLAALERLLSRATLPMPPAPAQPPSSQFVGREAELRRYRDELAREGSVVLVGLAGVGKTALAAALARWWQGPVFWHSFQAGEGVEALIWALAGWLFGLGKAELWGQIQRARQDGLPLPPAEALVDYLVQELRGEQALLCFDDAHLVEEEPLLPRLAPRLRELAQAGELRLLITARHAPAFVRGGRVEPLPGLGLADARAVLAHRGLALDEKLATLLAETVGGNAQLLLLAGELLRDTADDPALLVARLAEQGDIERYLLREVDAHLSDEERDIMGAVAALLGYGGTRDMIEAALEAENLRRPIASLAERGLLLVGERARERLYNQHAIVREFFYEQLGRKQRRGLHARAAAFYEEEEANPLLAARHYLLAGELARAAPLATRDVLAAVNAGQGRLLLTLLGEFEQSRLDAEAWLTVLLARGELGTLLRERALADASLREADELLARQADGLEARRQRARVCRIMGELLEFERPKEARAWIERGLTQVEDGDPELALLRLRLGSAMIAMGEYSSARATLEQALALLPAPPGEWHASALLKLGIVYGYQGEQARALDCYQRALDIFERGGNVWQVASTRQNLGIDLQFAGDWPRAAEEYNKALDLATRLGSIVRQTDLELCLGTLRAAQGLVEQAERHLENSIQLARRLYLQEQLAIALSSLAELCVRLARWDEARAALDEAEQIALAIELGYPLPEVYRSKALILSARQQSEPALVCARLALTHAQQLEDVREEGMSLRVLGQVLQAAGHSAAALEQFAQSQALLDGHDPYEAARTRLVWGRALREFEPQAAQALLQAAHAAFSRLGAGLELAEAQALLS